VPGDIYISTPRVYLTSGHGNGDSPYPAHGPAYEVPNYLPRPSSYGWPALDYGPARRLYAAPGHEEQQSEYATRDYAEERILQPPVDVPTAAVIVAVRYGWGSPAGRTATKHPLKGRLNASRLFRALTLSRLCDDLIDLLAPSGRTDRKLGILDRYLHDPNCSISRLVP
jgi:hypothetical protein